MMKRSSDAYTGGNSDRDAERGAGVREPRPAKDRRCA